MEYNLFKGLVTHIIDPSNFWMRIGTDYDMHLFNEYQQRLNAFYNLDLTKYTCVPDQMHPGYLVVAAESIREDGCHWERAQITRVDSGNKTADVFFVDLGHSGIVEVDRCRAITSDLFNFLPPQASRVSLGGVKPLSTSWTSRATSLLQRETDGQEVLTLLMHYDENSMCYTVIIYTRQTQGTWRSLIHQMQQEELAVGTGGMIKEILTDDIVEECLRKVTERYKQETESETCENGETEKLPVEEEVNEKEDIEKWNDDHVVGGSDDFLAALVNVSKNISTASQNQSMSSSETERMVTGFDYRTLMQTRSISLTQMQQEKIVEAQEVTKTNIERDLQRLESCNSQHDDQDWDTVQDTDYHVDIMSQIYHGVLERQSSSDDGMSYLWDVNSMHGMASHEKQKPSSSGGLYSTNDKDIGRRYYNQLDDEKDGVEEDETIMNNNGYEIDGDNGSASASVGLSEMDSYRLEKQIKEILSNPNNMESDVICASIYGVVEPDLDAPVDHLRVVICAILEHIIHNSSLHSEVAFAILDTYSDASEFGEAMIAVINELKDRFVKKLQRFRKNKKHKEFAHVLALIFKQAEDWQESVCKEVQDFAVALVERWIIFNKQRHLSGEELVQCEILYLETAQAFLTECFDHLKVKYSSNLREITSDIRCKLLQDETDRSIRTFLLDMLLTFNPDGRLERVVTFSVGTQTECITDDETSLMPAIDIGGSGDFGATKFVTSQQDSSPKKSHGSTDFNAPSIESSCVLDFVTSQLDWESLPKNVRNLPPRLLKKYLQEHDMWEPHLPSSPIDHTIAEDYHTDFPNNSNNSLSPVTIPKQSSCPSLSDEAATVQSMDLNSFSNDCFNSETNIPDHENVDSDFNKDEFPPSSPIFTEMSFSPNNVLERTSTSPQPILTSLQTDEDPTNEVTGQEDLGNNSTNLSDSSLQMSYKDLSITDEILDKSQEHETKVTSAVDNERPETVTGFNRETVTVEKGSDNETATEETGSGNIKVCIRIERETMIRYTPQQLREMNPFEGQPKLQLWDLWEPKEVLDKMIVLKNPGKSVLEDERTEVARSKSKLNPLAEEFDWRSSYRLPIKSDKTQGSSVDPSVLTVKGRKTNNKICEDNGKIYLNNGTGLQGIASDFFKPDTSINSTQDVEEGKSCGGGEMWHDSSNGLGGLEDLLNPKKRNDTGKSKKGRKKRGREIPLDQYLQEQATKNTLSEEREVVEEGKSVEDDGDNLFSPEALKMYEELEEQGVGLDGNVEDAARVLMSSNIGSHVSSSSKRPSIFSSIRPEQPTASRSPKPWVPGSRRFCTRCGSHDHVVYDCNERSSRLLQ